MLKQPGNKTTDKLPFQSCLSQRQLDKEMQTA